MDKLGLLQSKIRKCKSCCIPSYSYPLFQGSSKAKIMVISQAPSKKVLEYGQKWRDNLSGKTLRGWFGIADEIFYNPDIFYLTSIGKCYPGKIKGVDKLPDLICAEKWLKKEIMLVKPQLIITIGKFAFNWFFPEKNYLQNLNGKLKKWRTINVYSLPHPSGANAGTRKKLNMEKIIRGLRKNLFRVPKACF
jgi:uracil-DNA glycosylase family 4